MRLNRLVFLEILAIHVVLAPCVASQPFQITHDFEVEHAGPTLVSPPITTIAEWSFDGNVMQVGNPIGPDGIAVIDLNQDNRPDLAVANGPFVSVFLANGDGTFQPRTDFLAGSETRSIAVGSLNSNIDSFPDIVVVNPSGAGGGFVSVLLSNGDGTLQPLQPFPTGQSPSSVAVGDVNLDLFSDLVVTNQSDGTLTILLGDGSGSFTRMDFSTGPSPRSVAIGQMNSDDIYPDLVVAHGNSRSCTPIPCPAVSIHFGNGTGVFPTPTPVSAGPKFFSNSVVLGYVNGDSHLDVVAEGPVASDPDITGIYVLLGDGMGGFSSSFFHTGGDPGSLKLLNLDPQADSDLDLAFVHPTLISLFLNNGSGNFSPANWITPVGAEGPFAFGSLNSDVDSMNDLAAVAGGVAVYKGGNNKFDGLFANPQGWVVQGTWGRVFQHVTDNDICTENFTGAWLWTDDTTPTISPDPSMAFAPFGFVVHQDLDETITSPWVPLPGGDKGTVLSFREFPANMFNEARIAANVSIRTKNSQGVETAWAMDREFHSLSHFRWITKTLDITPHVATDATQIQVRFRVADWEMLGNAGAPTFFRPGPGPFLDDVQIGRFALAGPVIDPGPDTRSQAQDAFSTEVLVAAPPGHYAPRGYMTPSPLDRFGTGAFSAGADEGINAIDSRVLTTDAVRVRVVDSEADVDGIISVRLLGAITSGPHMGMRPPATAAMGAFFEVIAAPTTVPGEYEVDLADDYFVGGDVLLYFWLATDASATSSYPAGLSAVPSSVAMAEEATGGLLEVSFLPKLDWDPDYLDAVAANGPFGQVDPLSDPDFTNQTTQTNKILYIQKSLPERRSRTRTAFMWSLDNAGYQGRYDVYDLQGFGNTNNDLGSRATVGQATGYELIILDAGERMSAVIPSRPDMDSEKVDQAGWYESYLRNAAGSEVHRAALWIIGANPAEDAEGTSRLIGTVCGTRRVRFSQEYGNNPTVEGNASFTFRPSNQTVNFAGKKFSLVGDCSRPIHGDFDAIDQIGPAVTTHRWADPFSPGLSAIQGATVMNANADEQWSTVVSSFDWNRVVSHFGDNPPSSQSAQDLLDAVVRGTTTVIPGVPTHVVDGQVPAHTTLYQNAPNPFNPTTRIRFELASPGRVELKVFDVKGRLVRTLVNAKLPAQTYDVLWNGLDDERNRVSSGTYWCRLVTLGIDSLGRVGIPSVQRWRRSHS